MTTGLMMLTLVALAGQAGDGRSVPPPPDAQARREAFARRNGLEALRELATLLASRIDLQADGVREGFTAAYSEGRYGEALEAYKVYVLEKLRDPSTYGLPIPAVSPHALIGPKESGTSAAEELLENVVTAHLTTHKDERVTW